MKEERSEKGMASYFYRRCLEREEEKNFHVLAIFGHFRDLLEI